MKLNFYDKGLNRIGEIQTWVSMVWEEGYNTQGVFQLEVQEISGIYSLLRRWVYVMKPDSDTVMVILSVQTKDSKIVAVGAPATCVLARRVSTVEISNQNAETALRAIVGGMTAWENLELGEIAGITDIYTAQISDKQVLEYCENIAQAVDMGFKIVRNGKKLNFVCYKPSLNPNAKYSEEYGNVGNIEHTESDVNYYNVARVAGEGEGNGRVTVWAGNTTATGNDRLELYIDARDVQRDSEETLESYQERLIARGNQKLIEQARIASVSFDIADDSVSLGDVITVKLANLGIVYQVRIITVRETSQNNKTTRTVEVGEPILRRRL